MNTLEMFGECIKSSLTLEKMKVIIRHFKERFTGFSNFASVKLSLSLQENSVTVKQHV